MISWFYKTHDGLWNSGQFPTLNQYSVSSTLTTLGANSAGNNVRHFMFSHKIGFVSLSSYAITWRKTSVVLVVSKYKDKYRKQLHVAVFFILTLVLMSPDTSCICQQCRSRSVGFWRSQLIWICTVCHSECEFISTIWIKYSDWLKIRSGCGNLINSTWQGLILDTASGLCNILNQTIMLQVEIIHY